MPKKKPTRKTSKRTPKPRAANPAPTPPPRRPVRYRATPSAVSGDKWIPSQIYSILVSDEALVSRGEIVPIVADHQARVILVDPDVTVEELHALLPNSTTRRFGLIAPPGGGMPTVALAVAVESLAEIFPDPAPSEAE